MVITITKDVTNTNAPNANVQKNKQLIRVNVTEV